MRKLLAALLALVIFSSIFVSSALALQGWTMKDYLSEGFTSQGKLKPNYQHNLDVANDQIQGIDPSIRNLFLNERIQGEIRMRDGRVEAIGIELTQKGIEKVFRGKITNPTMQVHADEQSIIDIMESDSPVDTAVQELNAGKITYEAVSSPSASDATKIESNMVMTTKLFLVNAATFMSKFVHQVYAALAG